MTVYMDAWFQMSGITSTSCVGEVGEFWGWDNSITIRLIDKNVDKSIGNFAGARNWYVKLHIFLLPSLVRIIYYSMEVCKVGYYVVVIGQKFMYDTYSDHLRAGIHVHI